MRLQCGQDAAKATPPPHVGAGGRTRLPVKQWHHQQTSAAVGARLGGNPGLTLTTPRPLRRILPLLWHFIVEVCLSSPQHVRSPLNHYLRTYPWFPSQARTPRIPISLFNIDLKLYAKIIANRLRPLLSSIIHPDQVGFVPGWEARDNTIRTLSLISRARSQSDPMCLLSVDAKKEFDWVDWDFLRATLEHIGIGNTLLTRIMALYSTPFNPNKVEWPTLPTTIY